MFNASKIGTLSLVDFEMDNATDTAYHIFEENLYSIELDEMYEVSHFLWKEYDKFINAGLVEDSDLYVSGDCVEILDEIEKLIKEHNKEDDFDWNELNDLYGENW